MGSLLYWLLLVIRNGEEEMILLVVFLFLSYLLDKSTPARYKWRFAAQVILNGMFCVELARMLVPGSATSFFIQAARQLTLEVLCGTTDGSAKRFLNISLPSLEKGTWVAAGSRLSWWLFTSYGNLKSIVNLKKKNGLEFLLRSLQYAPIFFFLRGMQLTFCAEGHDWFCTVVAIWANLI